MYNQSNSNTCTWNVQSIKIHISENLQSGFNIPQMYNQSKFMYLKCTTSNSSLTAQPMQIACSPLLFQNSLELAQLLSLYMSVVRSSYPLPTLFICLQLLFLKYSPLPCPILCPAYLLTPLLSEPLEMR